MVRLFITLYLMVLASFGVFLLFAISLDTLGENIGDGATIDEKVSRGVFTLLDESIDNLEEAQKKIILEKHKKVFGPEFKLVELSSLDLDKGQLKDLEKGQVVSNEEEGKVVIEVKVTGSNNRTNKKVYRQRQEKEEEDLAMVYRKRPDSNQVWRLHLDFNIDYGVNESGTELRVEGRQYSEGMFYLIENKLSREEPETWSDAVNKLVPVFGIPVSLIEESTLKKRLFDNGELFLQLQEGKIVNISQGTKNATFVRKIAESSKVLQIGPVEIPWVMRNFLYLILLAFALSFATTMFLWILPLWSNLTKIKRAADDFGAGHYDARIPYRKSSSIANVSEAFNAMAERTQRSIRSHKELTTAVSHELRTPVARMRFALEMLSTSSKTDQQRFVNDINEDIDELDLLLEELLTYARFEQEIPDIKFTLEKLIPWISNSMEKLMPLADDKTLNYKVEGIGVNETALIEPRLMSRVLDNLVQNALRYATRNVEVTLSKDNQDYLLIVDDDGEGIPNDERENIFDAFTRIDVSRDRKSGGFGLGLAIANRIIKGHQGNIEVKTSPLGGARFEVRWDLKSA